MEAIKYQYWFLNNREIPYYKKMKLVNYFADAYHIYHASEKELLETKLLAPSTVDDFLRVREKADLNKEYENFMHSPYSFVTVEDAIYPYNLKGIFDPPYGMFYKGNIPDMTNAVAVVGARRCSEYGKKMALSIGAKLAKNGFTVVSGMARGIDTFAHQGSLEANGKTVAVLGCGADIIYPKENHILYEEIASHGAVMSEFPMGLQPIPSNFPIRNRIVAGMCKAVIVVEARLKSGSLITADQALEQGKDIYVVPGRVGDSLSEGCNKLVSQGAGVIYSLDQLICDLKDFSGSAVIEGNGKENLEKNNFSKKELVVYSILDMYPKSLAQIQIETKIDYLELISIVVSLVNKGIVKEVFKNNYVICG